MYAVVKTGGKQYRVAAGDKMVVERLPDAAGSVIELAEVLMLGEGASTTLGQPLVVGAAVAATVVEHKLGDKVIIFKKKRRHNYRRKRGHRQRLTVLHVTEILTEGRKAAAPVEAAPAEAKAAEAAKSPAKKPAAKKAAKKTKE
jgi:large subunit ribosomal protein L21